MFKIGDKIQWSYGPHDAYTATGVVVEVEGRNLTVEHNNQKYIMSKFSNRIKHRPSLKVNVEVIIQ